MRLPRESKHWPSPGSWTFVRSSAEHRPAGPTARVSCAKYGAMASLADHSIDAEGKVTPSLVCPDECGWHVDVVLDGWAEAIAP